MTQAEAQIRTLLRKYGAEDAAEEIIEIFKHTNRKKLNPSEVRTLRMMHRAGSTQRELARHYGINPATVSRIVSGAYH